MRIGTLSHFSLAGATFLALACTPPPITSEGGTTTQNGSGETGETTAATEPSSGPSSDPSTGPGDPTTEPPGVIPDMTGPPEPCDVFAQDCPEGEKCVPYASSGGTWDGHRCVPILGDQATGEPCTYDGAETALDDCDGTSMCWNVTEVEGELVGTCHDFCTGTADSPMCPEGAQCQISGDSTIVVCTPLCDPLLQDCDDEAFGCYWEGDSFGCSPTTQNIELGQPCGFINDCAKGNVCIDAAYIPGCDMMGELACCSSFCDIELGDAQCEGLPGTSCVSFWDGGEPEPGYETLGVCIAP